MARYAVQQHMRRGRLRACMMAAVCMAVAAALAAGPPDMAADAGGSMQEAHAQVIENDQMYVGDDGSAHIVGEIVNMLDVPIGGAAVQVTIHDRDGNVILQDETASLVNTIMPGMKGPFDLVLAGSSQASQMAASDQGGITYSLDLEYGFSDPKMQVIDIAQSELARDRHENMMITGSVANRGETTANTISVVATIYDGTGSVAAVTRVHTEPDYLRAGESAFFVIPIHDKEHAASASRYGLVAESEEYAAVPEFPVGTVALLAGTFAAYVAATKLARTAPIMRVPIAAAHPR